MAKYRNLTAEELQTFEKEFVEYLIVNGITADDWEKMKVEENEKAQHITDLFSDVILEGVLRKINFLEIRRDKYIQAIQCLDDKMLTVAVNVKGDGYTIADFNPETSRDIITENFEMITGEKKYVKEREQELFELTERGFVASDGKLFKELILATVTE